MNYFLILATFLSIAGYCDGVCYSNFDCPKTYDFADETYCCNSGRSGYCCDYDDYHTSSSVAAVVGSIFSVGCFVFLIVIISCCCCAACPLYQRRHRGTVLTNGQPGAVIVTTTQQQYPGSPGQPQTGFVQQQYQTPGAYPQQQQQFQPPPVMSPPSYDAVQGTAPCKPDSGIPDEKPPAYNPEMASNQSQQRY